MNVNNNSMASPHQSGYLEIILGSMYSGKTSRLVEIYKKCQFCNISVSVINHSIDNRYDDQLLSTHDKVKIPCIRTDKLMDIYTEFIDNELQLDEFNTIKRLKDKLKISKSEVILINEGQFFPDLYEFVSKLLNDEKKIYVEYKEEMIDDDLLR